MQAERRHTLAALGAAALATALPGCASRAPAAAVASTMPAAAPPGGFAPIVFVHGNGDHAALWMTTIWRFESNGWPRERLFAVDMPYPLARDDDGAAQPGRSSTAEQLAHLAAEVERVLARTGAKQVILVGNSRGGYAIRNYIQNGGGAAKVSHAVLGGTPNHGVQAIAGFRESNEFSGTGPFLRALNAPKNAAGDEVTGPVRWLTLRSDANDKFAQPDGLWIGQPGKPTGVTADGPALKGATNTVLPGADHREASFSPAAFAATWQFLTGAAPRTTAVVPEPVVVLDGRVTGLGVPGDPRGGNAANNLPLPGALVEVYACNPENGLRRSEVPAHRRTVGPDGRWGPFAADGGAAYEFVVRSNDYATTHTYRSPFPRSSSVVHLRPERIADADRTAGAVVVLTRPRGYFDARRDTMRFDAPGPLPGVPAGGSAGVSSSKRSYPDAAPRAVVAEFNGERIAAQPWPMADGHVTVIELTY